MPTYLYECPICLEFEDFHSSATKLEECPLCAERGVTSPVVRLINSKTKGKVELYGQDLIDLVKSDAKKLKAEASRSENVHANLIGESKYQEIQQGIDKLK